MKNRHRRWGPAGFLGLLVGLLWLPALAAPAACTAPVFATVATRQAPQNAVLSQDAYTLTVTADQAHYSPGDVVTAQVTATAPVETSFGSFGFTPEFDPAQLALLSVTTALPGTADSNPATGKLGFTSGADAIPVPPGGVVIATLKLQVKRAVATGNCTINLQHGEMTHQGADQGLPPTVVPKTVALHNITVRFQADAHSTLAATTAFVRYHTPGLWQGDDYGVAASCPLPVAAPGYRMSQAVWTCGGTGYTAQEVAQMAFTEDTVFTAQTVKTQSVSFAAGPGGTLPATAPRTVDAGAGLTDLPLPAPDQGFAFSGWHDGTAQVELASYRVTGDITLTATFAPQRYAWRTPAAANVSLQIMGGVTPEGQVVHGTDVVFSVTPHQGHAVAAVTYCAGGSSQGLAPVAGRYTIPGASILGDTSVTVASKTTATVVFTAMSGGSLQGNTTQVVNIQHVLQAQEVPVPVPAPGYRFAGWQMAGEAVAPVGYTVTGDCSFAVIFDHRSYPVVLPAPGEAEVLPVRGCTVGGATHGTDAVFSVTVGPGKLITGVYYQIGSGPKTEVTLVRQAFTLPGEAITGSVAITVETMDGTITLLSAGSYKALDVGRSMLVLQAPAGKRYALVDGTPLYHSAKYDAYVLFVAERETVEGLSTKLRLVPGVADEISYTGDLANTTPGVTPADAGIVSALLHQKRLAPTSDLQRLQADVNGDSVVTTADIALILSRYVEK